MDRELEELIKEAFINRDLLSKDNYREAVFHTVDLLNCGRLRVAEKREGKWHVNSWVKEAILLFFSISEMKEMPSGIFNYWDKIPVRGDFKKLNVRAVPPAVVRYGAYVEEGAVLMPCYVNIGARVGSGSMIDTWATVGSCAQVGKGVHISGGVGLGGVLEPPSAMPVIIEDGAFIGSRCIIVEGALIGKEAVIAANVTITASTKVIDVTGDKEVVYKGYVPERSVVVPGCVSKEFPAGTYYVNAALIIGKRKESTDKKTSLNETLREFALSV